MPLSYHPSHTHTSRHAQAHTITPVSHARASSMHTPARQPHTPCGLSASACPAACERLYVISVLYVPPRGVTPPAGVKISGRSSFQCAHKVKLNLLPKRHHCATKTPPMYTHSACLALAITPSPANTQPTERTRASHQPRWPRRAHTARTRTRRTKRRPGTR